jgi:hypothetical protein
VRRYVPCLLLVFAASSLAAAPEPTITPAILVAPGGTKVVAPPAASVRLSGSEFEILTLSGYSGTVAWDTTYDGVKSPIKLLELKPKIPVIGVRAGGVEPDAHESPDTPSVAVYAVGTGRASVVAWGVREGRPVKLGTFPVDANVGPQPPPKPIPDPVVPDPVVPDPVIPTPDAVLVAKFKNALAADIAANQGAKGTAAALAVVFDSGASLLDLNDPAIAPRTVGELYTKMVNASVAKGIPRLPYLKATRAVVDANLPILNGMTELTPALKADFQTKYRAVAAALAEASK